MNRNWGPSVFTRNIIGLSVITLVILSAMPLHSEPITGCEEQPGCPGAPNEYGFGELTVLEGNVIDVSDTLCPDKLGINADGTFDPLRALK